MTRHYSQTYDPSANQQGWIRTALLYTYTRGVGEVVSYWARSYRIGIGRDSHGGHKCLDHGKGLRQDCYWIAFLMPCCL